MGFIILIVMFVALWALMIRPQQKKMREQQQLVSSLEVGDEVVTSAGIYGAVAELEADIVWLEVAPEIELKIARGSIVERLTDDDELDDAELEAADTDDDA